MNEELREKLQQLLQDRTHGATYLQEKILEPLIESKDNITPDILKWVSTNIRENFPPMVQMHYLAYHLENYEGNIIEGILELKTQLKKIHEEPVKKCVQLIKELGISKIATISHSKMVISTLTTLHQKGWNFSVTVGEGYPALEGYKTAEELREQGIRTYIVKDEHLAKLSRKKEIILIGCDAMGKEWLINKIGSYELTITGGLAGIPTIVCSSEDKIVKPQFMGYQYDTDFLRKFKKEITDMQMELIPTTAIWKIIS